MRPELGKDSVRFSYEGLDGVRRFNEVAFDTAPHALRGDRAVFLVNFDRDQTADLEVRITGGTEHEPSNGRSTPSALFDGALASRRSEIEESQTAWARLSASNELFDSLLSRSQADLASLISPTTDGTFMMAGIPWFATLFARDSIITTLSVLPFNPGVAERTLRALARMQGSPGAQTTATS